MLSRLTVLAFLAPVLAILAQGAPAAPGSVDSLEEGPDGISPRDWAGFREAYEADRHVAYPVDDGYRARNPGQRWRTSFDGRGFQVMPDAGGWTWGLELESYGFAGCEQVVASPGCVRADGGRVAYEWNATVEEWYINDQRGLEHGYTVRRRPARGDAGDERPLVFTLRVRGELLPHVTSDGLGVHFLDGEEGTALTYTGLSVVDARGRELNAGFECGERGLRILIDERDARYPLTIDPIAQQAYLKSFNTDWYDEFGAAVAVSGDTVVIGAPFEDSNATGVNGDQSNNDAPEAGAVYVFVRSGTSWIQQAYLKASNAESSDQFGCSLALLGDTLVIGASAEDSNATGVNGNQANNSAPAAGAAYVFVRNGSAWSQQAYLKASNPDAYDRFGSHVAGSGDTVVVGAWREASITTGVNGDESDNSAFGAGAAYVFVRNGTTWSQQAYLKASNTDPVDGFSLPLAVSGDTVVVGASNEGSNAIGVNGDENDNSASGAGAAYVFVRSGTVWTQEAYLKPSNTDAGDHFGIALSLSGETVVVGAEWEDSNATGVNGDQSNNSAGKSGAAYVFERNGTSWSQQAYLKPSNTGNGDDFGISVAVEDDTVVVGAQMEDSSATGVDGDQDDNSASYAGAAYMFVRSGTAWSQDAYLKASNTGQGDLFGCTVALSGDVLLVGARWEDSGAKGVDGDQFDNGTHQSGAVYVFDLDAPAVATCQGYCGSGINAATDGYTITSPAVIGGTFGASVAGCAPGNAGALLVAYASSTSLVIPVGEILVNLLDASGELLGMPSAFGDPASFSLPVPGDPALSGFVFYTQAASFGGSICLHCAHECLAGY